LKITMKRKTLIIAALAAVGLSGCKKFLDQAANPNLPSVSTPSLALTGAEKTLADIPNGFTLFEGGSYTQYGYWDGNWAVSSGFIVQPALSQYNFTTSDFQVWTDLYLNISNLKNLEALATTAGSVDYVSIAQILEAYDWEQIVDNYNDAPYTDAFNPKILFPTFAKGSAIYAAEITALDNAMAAIQKNGSSTAPGSDDIIFGGNMTGWVKFANTLKLRYIMRQSNTSGFSGLKTELMSTASLGYLDGTLDAEANPGYDLNDAYGGQESPFWHAYGTNQNGVAENILVKANKYSINMLHGFNDPRLTQFYATVTAPPGSTEAGATVVRGLYLGDLQLSADTNGASTLSAVGPGLLKSASMNAVIFSGAESLFLQAEAVNDGMLTSSSSAQTLYQAAITASFESLGLTDAQAAAYYAQPIANVGWAASAGHLEDAIITQKYLALNGYGVFEQYNEWRRTGYPDNVPVSQDPAKILTTLPQRIYYPQVEYDTNSANVGTEGTITPATSQIFWALPISNLPTTK
jgi:hypothetical protein